MGTYYTDDLYSRRQKYTRSFKRAENKRQRDQNKYLKDNNDDNIEKTDYGFTFNSIDHPKYFEIDKKWKKTRARLDAPLLENAYYKIGDELTFVKRNEYTIHNDPNLLKNRPHLLICKKLRCYTLFSANHSDRMGKSVDTYYENVVSKGIVSKVKTSDDGSGEILYLFDEITPSCQEGNPHCLEADIITVLN